MLHLGHLLYNLTSTKNIVLLIKIVAKSVDCSGNTAKVLRKIPFRITPVPPPKLKPRPFGSFFYFCTFWIFFDKTP